MVPEWLREIQARTGWSDTTLLILALEYIMPNNRNFKEYLELLEREEEKPLT